MEKHEIPQVIRNSKSLPELIANLRAEGIDPAYYDWSMRMYLDSRAREKAVPIKGVFELTPYCNLDCKMCYVHLNSEQMQGCKLLSADEWETVMAQAVESGMMFATLTGGECLTYPDFERLYLFLYKHSVRIAVLTNGVLLNEEKIEFFKKNPPSSIQVTLYGANEEMYERVTGKREFTRVVENLRLAQKANLPLKLTLTPNPHLTLSENKEVIEFAASLGLRFQINSGLITPREKTGRVGSFNDLNIESYMDFFKLEVQLKGELPPTECIGDLPPVGESKGESPKGIRCAGARSSFNITWEGNMVPCNRLTHISAQPLKNGFADSWRKIHGEVMDIILPVECENCAYKYAAKGCAADYILNNNPGHASPERCKWCRAMVRNGFAKTV